MHIYDLIETRARFQLHVLRTKNEKSRTELFRKSFVEEGLTGDERYNFRKQYIEIIYNDMQSEIKVYEGVQTEVLKLANINK